MTATKMVYMIGAVIIAAIFFGSMVLKVKGMIETDAYFEAKLVLIGLRNNIMLASVLEGGKLIYAPPGSGKYKVTIGAADISVENLDVNVRAGPIPHYSAGIARPAELSGEKFCIVKKTDADCKPFVEICLPGTSCCAPQSCTR